MDIFVFFFLFFFFFLLITILYFFTNEYVGSTKLKNLLNRVQVDKEGNAVATILSFADP